MIDFVSAWKASSIVSTGAFGILGILKDYKDKETGKITRWGAVSLAGIVVSTLLGVGAQVKESSDDARAKAVTAKQTMELAQNTNLAVRDIQRGLSSLTSAGFFFIFDFDCPGSKGEYYCPYIEKDHTPVTVFTIDFFADPKAAAQFLTVGSLDTPISKGSGRDLWIAVLSGGGWQPLRVQPRVDGGRVLITRYLPNPENIQSDGRIISSEDLPGVTAIVSELPAGLRPSVVGIVLQSGQMIRYEGPFERVTLANEKVPGASAYRFVYPRNM